MSGRGLLYIEFCADRDCRQAGDAPTLPVPKGSSYKIKNGRAVVDVAYAEPLAVPVAGVASVILNGKPVHQFVYNVERLGAEPWAQLNPLSSSSDYVVQVKAAAQTSEAGDVGVPSDPRVRLVARLVLHVNAMIALTSPAFSRAAAPPEPVFKTVTEQLIAI